ncbi:hypothetical protein V6N13_088283 [Hibiscus sabdariffa]
MDFQTENESNGSIDKYKARLVIKGYRKKEGLDYFDTYSHVSRITSIRMILAIAVLRNLEVHQMDVKKAFLNGELDEEIYMEQPKGHVVPGQERKACRLVKSLYGLKQAPNQWHEKFDNVMMTNGFKINECDKSTMESDFVALDKTGEEAEWLRQFLEDIPEWSKQVPTGFNNLLEQDDKGDVSAETTGPAPAEVSAGTQISAEHLAVLLAYP